VTFNKKIKTNFYLYFLVHKFEGFTIFAVFFFILLIYNLDNEIIQLKSYENEKYYLKNLAHFINKIIHRGSVIVLNFYLVKNSIFEKNYIRNIKKYFSFVSKYFIRLFILIIEIYEYDRDLLESLNSYVLFIFFKDYIFWRTICILAAYSHIKVVVIHNVFLFIFRMKFTYLFDGKIITLKYLLDLYGLILYYDVLLIIKIVYVILNEFIHGDIYICNLEYIILILFLMFYFLNKKNVLFMSKNIFPFFIHNFSSKLFRIIFLLRNSFFTDKTKIMQNIVLTYCILRKLFTSYKDTEFLNFFYFNFAQLKLMYFDFKLISYIFNLRFNFKI